MNTKKFENLMKSEIKKIQKYAAARDGQPCVVSAWWTYDADDFTGFKTIGCEIMTADYSERLSDVFICVCLWNRRKSFISEGMERWCGYWVEPEEEAGETAEAAETKGENTMITKNEYRAMFAEDRDAARETVKAWRNAVEALDRIQTEDLIAEETPAHTVSLFVNEVGEDLARFVIASLINASAWDGRIYSNVAEWAKGQHSLDEEATQDAMLYSRMHKAHLNQIGEAMMKYQHTTTEEAQEATTEATEATEVKEDTNTTNNTNNTKEEQNMNTNTNTNTAPFANDAAMTAFPRLFAEIMNDAAQQKTSTAEYISLGYMSHWAESNRPSDRDLGLKRYSTDTRWNQYQNGTITREQAVEYAIKRACRMIDKDTAKKVGRLESVANTADSTGFSVAVTWAKSSTWGYNPTAEVTSDTRRASGRASGCGYDKESAAIADALNQIPAALRVLYTLAEKALTEGKTPYSKTATSGYSWGNVIGYGSGYTVLPYFEGGVGSSCFWSIFQAAGYEVRKTTTGKRFDCWVLDRSAA